MALNAGQSALHAYNPALHNARPALPLSRASALLPTPAQEAAWEPQPFELSDMAERLAELCAKAAQVPQYCVYGACGPMQRRVRPLQGNGGRVCPCMPLSTPGAGCLCLVD